MVLLDAELVKFFLGDPARIAAGWSAPERVIEDMRWKLGLHQPLYIQYLRWIGNVLHGDNI